MRKKRGFSLMEIIIALAVTVVALVAFLTVFSSSNTHAVQSRNRSVAILMVQSLMDDIETHTYGDPEPIWWTQTTEDPVTVWVSGRQQKMEFQKEITYQNGSLIGNSNNSSDLVTITVTWREGIGDSQTDQAITEHNKQLQVQVPVWR